jgi:hypothetical protein
MIGARQSWRTFPMTHKGIDYTVALTTTPGVWKWQFRIGEKLNSGKTETRINRSAAFSSGSTAS